MSEIEDMCVHVCMIHVTCSPPAGGVFRAYKPYALAVSDVEVTTS